MNAENEGGGKIAHRGQGLGVPSPAMVEERAREIALIDGRRPDEVNETDRDQALRELTGKNVPADDLPEIEGLIAGRDPSTVPDRPAQRKTRQTALDEQSELEKTVEQSVEEAQHDQMLQSRLEDLERRRQRGEDAA